MVKKEYNASTIIEMAYLMPVVLMTWALVLFTLFYYHDKSILAGAAYETAVVASEHYQQNNDIEIVRYEQYFADRISGKLLYFPYAIAEIEMNSKKVSVTARANARRFQVKITESTAITEAEKSLRKIEMIKEGLEDIKH